MASTQFNSSTSQAAAATLNAASSTGFNMMELAYNRQRQQMVDTDVRNSEQRRIVESDRAFQADQNQAAIANAQRDAQLKLQQRQQSFSENKYDEIKKDADQKAAEVRRLTSAMGLPPVSDLESLGVVTTLMAKNDATNQRKAELKDTTALRSGILTAATLKDPAARLKAVQDAFANNPNAKVDTETMKQAATLVNRDRLMVNQAVFNQVAIAGNLTDLQKVQSMPGFAEWYADSDNRAVWKERFTELKTAEPSSKSKDVLKINNDGTAYWDNGIPAVMVEDTEVVNADGKRVTVPLRKFRDKMGNNITVQQYNDLLARERGRMMQEATDEAGAQPEDGGSLYPSTEQKDAKGKPKAPLTASDNLLQTFYTSF